MDEIFVNHAFETWMAPIIGVAIFLSAAIRVAHTAYYKTLSRQRKYASYAMSVGCLGVAYAFASFGFTDVLSSRFFARFSVYIVGTLLLLYDPAFIWKAIYAVIERINWLRDYLHNSSNGNGVP